MSTAGEAIKQQVGGVRERHQERTEQRREAEASEAAEAQEQALADLAAAQDALTDDLDAEEVDKTANSLVLAVDRLGTKEDEVFRALEGNTRVFNEAVAAAFRAKTGRSLDEVLSQELRGRDAAEAQAHLSGDRVGGALAALDNAVGATVDEDRVEEVLQGLEPGELAQLRGDPEARAVIDRLGARLRGRDREVFEALLEGDAVRAKAIGLERAMSRLGTDEKAIEEYLADADEAERQAIEKAFAERRAEGGDERGLEDWIRKETGGATEDLGLALLEGDEAAAEAARLKKATRLVGGDKDAVIAAFEGRSDEEREELEAAFSEEYGDDKLDRRLAAKLLGRGDDKERIATLRQDGAIEPVDAIYYALHGVGTDEALVNETLDGLTKADVDALRSEYAAKYGENLDQRIAAELGGRDQFEAELDLEGEATTPEQLLDRARRRDDFERRGLLNSVGRTVVDVTESLGVHSRGEHADRQLMVLEALVEESGELADGASIEDVKRAAGFQEAAMANYAQARDKLGDALATAATVAAGVVMAAASMGTAAPFIAAALAPFVRLAVSGKTADMQEFSCDLIKAQLSAALGSYLTGGAAPTKALKSLTEFVGPGPAREITQKALAGLVKSGAKGALNAALSEENWEEGVGDLVVTVLTEGAREGAGGAASGAAGGVVDQHFGDADGLGERLVHGAVKDAVAGTTASVVEDVVLDGETYDKQGEDVARDLFDAGLSGIEDAVSSVGSALGEERAWKKKILAADDAVEAAQDGPSPEKKRSRVKAARSQRLRLWREARERLSEEEYGRLKADVGRERRSGTGRT